MDLNDCGCCEGTARETPAEVLNRPGLSALVYRAGTHAQFKATMLSRLSGSGPRALAALTTRDDDDLSIALLDAWATVGDVLTFYQERLANEAYLRTATERLSVRELARLIDYQLNPGVAASTYLAFTLEEAPGALGQALSLGTTAQLSTEPLPPVVIDVGAKVQSVPAPGEQAQTFETVEAIEARAEWNAIRPRLTQPQGASSFLDRAVIVKGTTSGVKKGDMLLVVRGGKDLVPRNVVNVVLDEDAKTTRIDFDTTPAPLPSYTDSPGASRGSIDQFLAKSELTGTLVQQLFAQTWREEDLSALSKIQNWPVNTLIAALAKQRDLKRVPASLEVFALRQRAALFGYNAPKQPKYNSGTVPKPPHEWDEWPLDATEAKNKLFLDAPYDAIVPKSYVTIDSRDDKAKTPILTFVVQHAAVVPRTAYGISSKAALLTLDSKDSWRDVFSTEPRDLAPFRDVSVHAQSELLDLAELPIEDVVEGDTVTLDGVYLGLKVGRRIILHGQRFDLQGVAASETRILKEVLIAGGVTVVTFDRSLAHRYVRKTVTINANVAPATHGETVQEVLGGGDAGTAFQQFTLKQPPLTYVSAPTATGGRTTLEIRVNDVRWHEVPSFFGHGPDERIYITRLGEDARTTVIFGDGATGARLPTGQENVKARYRKGLGLAGLVKADQLTLLMTRPLGVKGATNPTAAAGAADGERLEDARRNAPLTVLTLGRIVSLRDYEDFATAFSGIGKALGTWTWFGETRGVFVTVAGAAGAEIEDGGDLHTNLVKAMQDGGDPRVPLTVRPYQPRLFRLAAAISVNSDLLPDTVAAEVEQQLRATFSFEARAFGQPVHLSEVVGAMQRVRGVVSVEVKAFHRSDRSVTRETHIPAAAPAPGDDEVVSAELLTLDPRSPDLEVVR
jgi:predicted phage baseplate assembly protein